MQKMQSFYMVTLILKSIRVYLDSRRCWVLFVHIKACLFLYSWMFSNVAYAWTLCRIRPAESVAAFEVCINSTLGWRISHPRNLYCVIARMRNFSFHVCNLWPTCTLKLSGGLRRQTRPYEESRNISSTLKVFVRLSNTVWMLMSYILLFFVGAVDKCVQKQQVGNIEWFHLLLLVMCRVEWMCCGDGEWWVRGTTLDRALYGRDQTKTPHREVYYTACSCML